MKNRPGSEKGEDLDVREVHGQLLREKSEPREMFHAAPSWLKHGIYAPLTIWALIYLLSASGGFKWNEYYEGFRSTVKMAEMEKLNSEENGSSPESPATPMSLRDEGKTVYQNVCSACHQPNGKGLPGAFPPLAGVDWVAGDERRLALIVLHGLMGPITVNGETWNSVMPPQGANLTDREIAAALSYVRSEWGNNAPEVLPETVGKMRAEFKDHAPWTNEALTASDL